MSPFAVEILENILLQLVGDSSLDESFEDRATPFNEYLIPYPANRSFLATACTRVCSLFYDLATPIVWQYLVVRREEDLNLLLRLTNASGGLTRKPRQSIVQYAARIDFRAWRRVGIERSIELLSRLPNIQVLSVECLVHPGPLWRHPLNEEFYRGLPKMCPDIRRLQFLEAREAPTLEEVAFLSRECKELRSLHVAHLSEPYHRFFVGPEPADNSRDPVQAADDDEASETESDRGGSSDGWSAGGDPHSVSGSGGSVDEEDDDEGDEASDRLEGSTTFPIALVGVNSDEDVDPLSFGFSKLQNLALGMGNIHGSISERRSIGRLVQAMSSYHDVMAQLRQIDVYVPLDNMKDHLAHFKDVVKTSVLHMYYNAYPDAYAAFTSVRRMLIVIHTTWISIPFGLDDLEEVEILIRRPAFSRSITTPQVAGRIMLTARSLLDMLLRTPYPSLKRVVLWKGALVHHGAIDALASMYRGRFAVNGMQLEAKARGVRLEFPLPYPSTPMSSSSVELV